MRNKIFLAIVSLHLGAALYVCAGALFAIWVYGSDVELPRTKMVLPVFLVLVLAIAIGIELVAFGLYRRKFWAWVAGLCIFGLFLPTVFFVLGALGLWGLLDPRSRAAFGVGART